RIELYTEPYASAFPADPEGAVAPFARAAAFAHELGLGVNAGHDLDQANLGKLIEAAPMIAEVSIGHALITEALYEGLETTIRNYQQILGN
ncbi:MAG: pyridoxine 5'-phosphate synthase, partial [Bacteroidota bacterium]